MSAWSREKTDNPDYADKRILQGGTLDQGRLHVSELSYAGNDLEKARETSRRRENFAQAAPYTIRQGIRVLANWPVPEGTRRLYFAFCLVRWGSENGHEAIAVD